MSETIGNSIINSNELNECVFINTNNPKVKDQTQKNNVPFPLIKPPFPPLIDPKDLLIIGKDNKPTRSPNAFIIYRKVFFKTIKNEGHVLPMTSISSMASQSWEREPEEIKKYYKSLAKEAYNYRNERFPKKDKRKKREKWNIISFKSNIPTSINNNIPDNINNEPLNLENLQLPTPTEDVLKNPLIEAFMQINNGLLQNLIISNELSLNILNSSDNVQNNIQINSPIDDLFEENNVEFLNLQEQIYQSPNLLLSDESNFTSPNLNELINSFSTESLQQMENANNEQIEQEKEIQQFIINNLPQQFFSQDLNNNDLTNLNSFDSINAFFDDPQPNFFNYLDLNNDNVIANDLNTETNSELLTDFIQYEEVPNDLGITFASSEFENFSLCNF
ncbi:hypothetical protein C1645_831927 [Glomus cerebriforme]|uniref:HMG box domain-containing protein n=1 Tax=Glomus cerebriforme TaxID=658196 RepID=A0A397SIF4_9GLOM|nr:hypothetical protein C1645_831927 [Glomus cerebriforme]